MIKNFKLNLIVVILFLIFVIWDIYRTDKAQEAEYSKFEKEYPLMLIKDSVNSTVINVFHFSVGPYRRYPYSVAFTLSCGLKYDAFSMECINNPDMYIDEAITKNAELFKNPNSDTLRVSYGNKKYFFIIQEKRTN